MLLTDLDAFLRVTLFGGTTPIGPTPLHAAFVRHGLPDAMLPAPLAVLSYGPRSLSASHTLKGNALTLCFVACPEEQFHSTLLEHALTQMTSQEAEPKGLRYSSLPYPFAK